MTKPGSVAGKIVAVTGGARGIGLAIATALHSMGAKVAIGDILSEFGRPVKEAGKAWLGLAIGQHVVWTSLIADPSTDFLDAVEDQLGPIDVIGEQRRRLSRSVARSTRTTQSRGAFMMSTSGA